MVKASSIQKKMVKISSILTILACCFVVSLSQVAENPCVSKDTCGECMIADPECAWCSQDDFTLDGSSRCDLAGNLRGKCLDGHIIPDQGMTNRQNHYGRECECNENQATDDIGCYYGNDTAACSGRGVCRCGKCECFKRQNPEEKLYGKYCECDNYSCDRSNGKICSGLERGICECGICQCMPGWTGYDCSCIDSIDACISPNGKICSGHGQCECGNCRCDDLEGGYSGIYCEQCPTCPLKCDEYRYCVECQIFPGDNDVPPENCDVCTFISIGVDKVEVMEEGNEKLCVFRDDNDCQFTFKYKLGEDEQPIVHAQRTKDCPIPKSSCIGRSCVRNKPWVILSYHRHESAIFMRP